MVKNIDQPGYGEKILGIVAKDVYKRQGVQGCGAYAASHCSGEIFSGRCCPFREGRWRNTAGNTAFPM